jgi:hypothetical protein
MQRHADCDNPPLTISHYTERVAMKIWWKEYTESQGLLVQFAENGPTYVYPNASPSLYREWKAEEFSGSFFNARIRPTGGKVTVEPVDWAF